MTVATQPSKDLAVSETCVGTQRNLLQLRLAILSDHTQQSECGLAKHTREPQSGDGNKQCSVLAGATPLHYAVLNGRTEAARQLVEAGADIDACTDAGLTALQIAVIHGHTDCVEYLLSCGSKLDRPDRLDRTALHEATENGQLGVADRLLNDKVKADQIEAGGEEKAQRDGKQ